MADYGTATSDAERLLAVRESIGRTLRAQEYGIRGERVRRPSIKDLFAREDEIREMVDSPNSQASLGCITQITSPTV